MWETSAPRMLKVQADRVAVRNPGHRPRAGELRAGCGQLRRRRSRRKARTVHADRRRAAAEAGPSRSNSPDWDRPRPLGAGLRTRRPRRSAAAEVCSRGSKPRRRRRRCLASPCRAADRPATRWRGLEVDLLSHLHRIAAVDEDGGLPVPHDRGSPAEPVKPVSQASRSSDGGTYSFCCWSARGITNP